MAPEGTWKWSGEGAGIKVKTTEVSHFINSQPRDIPHTTLLWAMCEAERNRKTDKEHEKKIRPA